MRTYTTRRQSQKSAKPARPENRVLVVKDNGPGEDLYIYTVDINHPMNIEDMKAGKFRLFDEAKDSRGPAVPVTLTYGVREDVWHPETEGSYFVEFILPKDQRPDSIKNYGLHFGDVSSPQPTKAIIHRLYLDIVEKSPELVGYVHITKRPCVFCRDSALAPGGSKVVVDMATLPAPADNKLIARFYM